MDSFTVALTDTDTHNLHDLLVTADAAKSTPKGLDLITEFREMTILADAGNGAAKLYVGGSDVSSTIHSYPLTAGASQTYRRPTPAQKVYCKEVYVRASANLTFHIEGQP